MKLLELQQKTNLTKNSYDYAFYFTLIYDGIPFDLEVYEREIYIDTRGLYNHARAYKLYYEEWRKL